MVSYFITRQMAKAGPPRSTMPATIAMSAPSMVVSKGWTHIVGSADGGVLFYNAESGEGGTASLDNAGHYSYVGPIHGFSGGWTHIVGTPAGGLLFYNAASGEGKTGSLDNAGHYSDVGPPIHGFSKGWTHTAGV